jgi:hypothetical protein
MQTGVILPPEEQSPTKRIETTRSRDSGAITAFTPDGTVVNIFTSGEVQVSHPTRDSIIVIDPLGIAHEYSINPPEEPNQPSLFHRGKVYSSPQRGSILLEMALCIPVFLLLVLGGFDLVWCCRAKSNLDWIAQQAASCSAKTSCDVNALVNKDANGLSLDSTKITRTFDPGAGTATLVYAYKAIGPFWPNLTLTSSATAVK